MDGYGSKGAAFAPGEGEEMAAELRFRLRSAAAMREAGQLREAERREDEGLVIWEAMLDRLKHRFDRYARGAFGEEASESVEDAVCAMATELWRRLADLRSESDRLPGYFNQLVRWVCLTAIKTVRRESGMDEWGAPATEGYMVISLETGMGDEEDGDGVVPLVEQLEDPAATAALGAVLGDQMQEDLLAVLPARVGLVLRARVAGEDWNRIADLAGASEKTVRNDFKRAVATINELTESGRLLVAG